MTTSGRQPAVTRRTVVAIAIAATILLPFALPAGAANLASGTAAVAPPAGVLTTGADAATGPVRQLGAGTPVQAVTDTASALVQKTTTGPIGALRPPPAPAPVVGPNPQPAPAPAPPPAAPDATAAASSDLGSITPTTGSASGLSVDSATLLLAQDATAMPLVAEALSAAPSALVLVAEPLARSLNAAMGFTPATTSDSTQEVQAARNLPAGVLTEALIAVALLVAATAALVAELGLKRSASRAA